MPWSETVTGIPQASDTSYPAGTAIKLILDNHSAHISKETRTWLATRPTGRFEFTFTPKHGSWLNLVEDFSSKFARSVLRHIRVTSKTSSSTASSPASTMSIASGHSSYKLAETA
jgi:transposase